MEMLNWVAVQMKAAPFKTRKVPIRHADIIFWHIAPPRNQRAPSGFAFENAGPKDEACVKRRPQC